MFNNTIIDIIFKSVRLQIIMALYKKALKLGILLAVFIYFFSASDVHARLPEFGLDYRIPAHFGNTDRINDPSSTCIHFDMPPWDMNIYPGIGSMKIGIEAGDGTYNSWSLVNNGVQTCSLDAPGNITHEGANFLTFYEFPNYSNPLGFIEIFCTAPVMNAGDCVIVTPPQPPVCTTHCFTEPISSTPNNLYYSVPAHFGENGTTLFCDNFSYSNEEFGSYRIGVSPGDDLYVGGNTYGTGLCTGSFNAPGNILMPGVNYLTMYLDSNYNQPYGFIEFFCTEPVMNPGDCVIIPYSTSPVTCTENCFSNVLFLPGIKGSRLKTNSDIIWPPAPISNDVNQLVLDENGESINDIYTNGILNDYFGRDIYLPFSEFMDDLASQDVINEWLPMAYDWRFSPERILEDGIKTETGVMNVIERIEELALDSKSDKVTIVAHSMGGLFGKAIIKELEEQGKDHLIDSFVMVSTPQLGTPQAIGGLLHGNGEDVGIGFIVNGIDMRRIGQNMQTAYDLLPSQEYFNQVSDPVISFDSSASFTQAWRNFWGNVINNYTSFSQFVIGQGVLRSRPDYTVLRLPEVLRSDLFDNADNFHNKYDNYQFPEHIRVVQVAGWGMPTVKNIEYKIVHLLQGYDVNFTREGDKTVTYPSAISSTGESYYFNIFDYNDFTNGKSSHKDLLSTNSIQNLLDQVIRQSNIQNINFISLNKPVLDDLEDQLIVSTKSPVVLGAYDELGNFTGIDPDQDLSQDVLFITENIPGSTFLYTNESQYIFLPKEGNYNFIYKGVGEGPTTVEVSNFSNDIITPITSFIDIPTTSNTVADFMIESDNPENTTISIDLDGNGEEDFSFPYIFSGFLQPINDTAYQIDQDKSVFKAGSTVPVKFQLKNIDGEIVQANTTPIWLNPQKGSKMNEVVDESVYTINASSGTNYKWDPVSQQYIYNWSTKGLTAGYWYKIYVKLDDGNTHTVTIGLK